MSRCDAVDWRKITATTSSSRNLLPRRVREPETVVPAWAGSAMEEFLATLGFGRVAGNIWGAWYGCNLKVCCRI